MPIYLQHDSIPGEATHQDHVGWWDIESLHWNVSRNMNTQAGSSANREASEPVISEVIVTKVTDSSSVGIFKETCTGNIGKTVVIDLVTTGNPGQQYTKYILSNTLLAGYSVDTSGDRPIETIRLNFTHIEQKFTPYKTDGSADSPKLFSYDLATAVGS
ncbi:Hcp family type VI secretion system effector [Pseudaestuariivita rosea]|uniref:Hcp family type VI secretion system effector n=1 Tax=Pseudaestuariivita rosea TaxID=2763263 RepID=UPI001ABAD125|nr:type VI secretion system tube protein Hcp [Pseudaestuariivita rosea]